MIPTEVGLWSGFKAPAKRAGLPRETKGKFDAFSRKRMRELTGTVPDKTDFRQFLARQTKANQDDTLGKTKAKLFRDGGMDIGKFVDKAGNERTLADLARTKAQAFREARLDPKGFLR